MKDPAILLYKDKWLIATKGMRADAKGWYLNLIIYQHEMGSLPNDIEELANLCDVRFSEFEQFKQVFEQVIKQKFELNSDGKLENLFAREIIQNRETFKEKRSDAGKLSYVLRYFRTNFKYKKGFEEWFKSNVIIDFDIKNEQVLKQVFEQNIELYINVNVNKDIIINNEDKVITWKDDFNIYIKNLNSALKILLADEDWLAERERFHPNLEIKKTLEKSYLDFWAKEAGWKNKIKSKSIEIDWKATFNNALTQKMNQVYKTKEYGKESNDHVY